MTREMPDEQIMAMIKQLERIGDANTKSIELLHYRAELLAKDPKTREFNWGFWMFWR